MTELRRITRYSPTSERAEFNNCNIIAVVTDRQDHGFFAAPLLGDITEAGLDPTDDELFVDQYDSWKPFPESEWTDEVYRALALYAMTGDAS